MPNRYNFKRKSSIKCLPPGGIAKARIDEFTFELDRIITPIIATQGMEGVQNTPLGAARDPNVVRFQLNEDFLPR